MKKPKNPTEILNGLYAVYSDSNLKVHIENEKFQEGSIQSQTVESLLLLEIVRLLQGKEAEEIK